MAAVRCDISGVIKRATGAVRLLRSQRIAGRKEILDRKLAEEKATHLYKNRTGAAEQSTVVTGVFSGDRYDLKIGMGVRYAYWLDLKGLTRIRQIAAEARQEIREYLRDYAKKIAAGDY